MKNDVVKFETAKLAKEIGFDIIDGVYFYTRDETLMGSKFRGYSYLKEMMETKDSMLRGNIVAPTQSLLQRWIRETHHIDVIISSNLMGYGYIIYNRYPPKNHTNNNLYQHYEQALETGLVETLNLIKNKDEK